MAKLTMVALEKMIGALSERINKLENPPTAEGVLEEYLPSQINALNERIGKVEQAMTPEALAKGLGGVVALRRL